MPRFWQVLKCSNLPEVISRRGFGFCLGQVNPLKAKRSRRLSIESLETRKLMASLPFGASPDDLGEFLLGRVAVTPVLLESNGAVDENILNWTAQQKTEVLQNITEGLQWWKDLLATQSTIMQLDWVIDTTFIDTPVETSYEPITRVSNDYVKWVPEFLDDVGLSNASNLDAGIRAFNHSQRVKLGTDWSFTIFVVNSRPNQIFAPGGSFSRAFAFAGGLYFVTPSNRPASTYTHETGHIFWARDEYQGGGNYYQNRGYYDSQNTNAIDLNPDLNFQQSLSIMSAGVNLETAYNTVTTSQATLAQLGWQDSDGDGIFDVLDVPLQLDGVGRFNATTNTYQFTGKASAKALPNRNSSGLQNDITLNRVGRIEYRFDDSAPWTTAVTLNQYQADLNLSIPVPSGTTGSIQIRAIDPRIGITSGVFRGSVSGADLTAESGIAGFVWSDTTNDGVRQSTEPGLFGLTVQVVDANGVARNVQTRLEPDNLQNGVIAPTAFAGATLRAIGMDADGTLGVTTDTRATTGTKVLIPYSPIARTFRAGWRDDDQNLRITLDRLQSTISVDVIGIDAVNFGRLEVYSASGQLLERITSASLTAGRSATLTITRPTEDISYAIVKGHAGTRIGIDNIRFGAIMQTTTGPFGEYRLPGLSPGTYSLLVTPSNGGYTPIPIAARTRAATVALSQPTVNVNFGLFTPPSPWQNQVNQFDVNRDGSVFALDVLLVINAINTHGILALPGSSVPTTFSIDVNGDSMLTPLDVLTVINFINASNRGIEGEGQPVPSVYQAPSAADGEEPPEVFQGLYLGDDESSEAILVGSLSSVIDDNEPGLLGLVGSSTQAILEIKSQRHGLLAFDSPALIDSAISSLNLNS